MTTPVRQLSLGPTHARRLRGRDAARSAASCSSTSRRSASTSSRRKRSARSSPTSTASAARPSSSRRTTWPTSSGCAGRIVLIDDGTLIFDGELETAARRVRNAPHAGRDARGIVRGPDLSAHRASSRTDEADVVRLRFDRRTITRRALIRRVTERYTVSDSRSRSPRSKSSSGASTAKATARRPPTPARTDGLMLEPYVEFAQGAFAREATYRFEVFTSIGSLLVRVYLLRMVWAALYAHNAARTVPLARGCITYSTVALLMSLVLEIDQTRLLFRPAARRQHRDRPHEADQRAALLLQRRHRRSALPRLADRAVAGSWRC